jgi:hypothetical protein
MIPNIHTHEQLMFERGPQRQQAAAEQRLAARCHRERDRLPPRLVAHRAAFLFKLGSSLKRLEAREKQVMYDH